MKHNHVSRLVKSYPLLARVPESLHRKMIQKAVLHPITVLFALFCATPAYFIGIQALMVGFDYIFGYISNENGSSFALIKLFFTLLIAFLCIFYCFKKLVIPFSLKRVIQRYELTKQPIKE